MIATTPIRDQDLSEWMNASAPESVRVESFRRWVRRELGKRLFWPRDTHSARWQMANSVHAIEEFVAEMEHRRFRLPSDALASVIIDRLDYIGLMQRGQQIDVIYAFVRRCLQRYIKIRADELKVVSGRTSTVCDRVFPPSGLAHERSMVEIIEERTRLRIQGERSRREYVEGRRRSERAQRELKLDVA